MTAYSFTDLRIKSIQIKGERPVIVILSGAGLSAESGIPTYRNADNNWNRTDSMDSVDMKHRPQLVFDSINRRIEAYDQAKPNAAHLSIAEFKKKWRNKADIIHITQNIDTLCEEAGDAGVFHLHGSFLTSRCTECGATFPRLGLYKEGNVCPACKASGWSVRTDVVLFGERPHGLDWIPGVLRRADVFVAVGTSGMVYPAAGFVTEARRRNCRTRLLIAKDAPLDGFQPLSTEGDSVGHFTKFVRGNATTVLPAVLETLGNWIEKVTQAQATETVATAARDNEQPDGSAS